MSGLRKNEHAIDPSGSGIRWFSLNEALDEFKSAEAYMCKWEAGDNAARPKEGEWVRNEEDRLKVRVYSTAPGVTGAEDDVLPCWFNCNRKIWEVIAVPAATGVPFRNDSSGSEEVPSRGVMRVTGSVTVDGKEYVTIAKPNTDFKRKYLVNLGDPVPYNKYGLGTWLEEADWVLYNNGSGTPAIGESWGPKNDSWKLEKWRYGFTIVGNPSGGPNYLVRAWQEEINEFIGKTDSTHNKNSTGTVSIYDGNLADTTDNMASVENKFANVSSGKWVQVRWNAGKWHLVAAEC